jgi:hypothetical protein
MDENGNNKPVLSSIKTNSLKKRKGLKVLKEKTKWYIYHNFVQMYKEVYNAMVKARVAETLAEPMWVDNKQQITSKENAFAQKVTHLMPFPDCIVFVDKVGCNTSQEGDRKGGEKKY